MRVLAIDPGPVQSAWVFYDGARVVGHGIDRNGHVLDMLAGGVFQEAGLHVVFEQITSYGMPVGAEIFETVFWTGRMYEAVSPADCAFRLPRQAVKLYLCGSPRAKDGNIRQALIDKFGGKAQAIGKKATPGPLYGIKADEWAALALAVTWLETKAQEAA